MHGNLFSFYSQVGKNRTAFDGEVAAIRLALTQLYCHLKILQGLSFFMTPKGDSCREF